jgi:hypothetical protein
LCSNKERHPKLKQARKKKRENTKALRFNALIDKEEFMYKSEDGHTTPYNSTQEKEKLI